MAATKIQVLKIWKVYSLNVLNSDGEFLDGKLSGAVSTSSGREDSYLDIDLSGRHVPRPLDTEPDDFDEPLEKAQGSCQTEAHCICQFEAVSSSVHDGLTILHSSAVSECFGNWTTGNAGRGTSLRT